MTAHFELPPLDFHKAANSLTSPLSDAICEATALGSRLRVYRSTILLHVTIQPVNAL
jgi:hypothetical protein